jgi:hypothetical protein
MQSSQLVPGPVVIEKLRPIPRRLGMALLTALLSELLAVRILRAVTCHAGGTEAEKRPVECTVLTLELQDVGCCDQLRLVAIVTGSCAVRFDQLKANRLVVKRGGIESH